MDDETDLMCQEQCFYKHSMWQKIDKGVWSLGGLDATCNNANPLQSVQLTKNKYGEQRYDYKCCSFNGDAYSLIKINSGKSKTDWIELKDIDDLYEYQVKCLQKEFLYAFNISSKIEKNGWFNSKKYYIQISYGCSAIKNRKHLDRATCKEGVTSWGAIREKEEEINFHQHDIGCGRKFGNRWFLNGFKLEKNENTKQMRYKIWCCRVLASKGKSVEL